MARLILSFTLSLFFKRLSLSFSVISSLLLALLWMFHVPSSSGPSLPLSRLPKRGGRRPCRLKRMNELLHHHCVELGLASGVLKLLFLVEARPAHETPLIFGCLVGLQAYRDEEN